MSVIITQSRFEKREHGARIAVALFFLLTFILAAGQLFYFSYFGIFAGTAPAFFHLNWNLAQLANELGAGSVVSVNLGGEWMHADRFLATLVPKLTSDQYQVLWKEWRHVELSPVFALVVELIIYENLREKRKSEGML
jgi:hypothetical protein